MRPGTAQIVAFGMALLVGMLVVEPRQAQAQSGEQWTVCMRAETQPDAAIRACNALIQSGRETPRNSAIARYNVGIAQFTRRDFDPAIESFGAAIRLDASYAAAFASRARAYDAKGRKDLAERDFRAVLNVGTPNNIEERWAHDTAAKYLGQVSSSVSAPKASSPRPAAPKPVAQAPTTANQSSSPPFVDIGPPVFTPPTATLPQASRRVALVIGNSSYKSVAVLPNPKKDAAGVAAALRSLGFQKVILETDLTRERLLDTLRSFAAESEKADWALVYFAGHAIEMNGTNYLIPVEAKLATDRDVDFESVPLDKVMSAVDGAKLLRLVLLDSCRDNPFLNQMRRSTASRNIGRGLARVEPDAGTLVVYAAKHGQIALDGDGGNSPFASAFINRIRTPGLEVRRLFDLVRDDVVASTNQRQQPFSYGSVSGSADFYFVER